MNRRNFLTMASAAALPMMGRADAAPRAPIGVAWTSFMMAKRINDPLVFADYLAGMGAAGMQVVMPDPSAAVVHQLREKLDRSGMYFEGAVGVPFQESDSAKFEPQMQGMKDAGARCVRFGCLSGRRYETFKTMETWREFEARSKAAIKRMVPIAERLRLPIAMENHKDWLAAELVNLMHQYSSEYLGVCLDFNNNLSLLEDPYEVVKALAPYTIATHFKDARISLAPDGLLLGDVVLGAGVLDLARMLDIVREGGRKPKITLEMITRPPLRVPVFSPEYWNTFPERPGMRLAQTIAFGAKLPADPSSNKAASPEAQAQLEEDNVKRCLQWSAEHVT